MVVGAVTDILSSWAPFVVLFAPQIFVCTSPSCSHPPLERQGSKRTGAIAPQRTFDPAEGSNRIKSEGRATTQPTLVTSSPETF